MFGGKEIGDFDVSYPGYYVVILDELARRAGFSWRKSYGLIFPPRVNDSFRLQPNATVADLLLWSVNAYDISFSEWDRSIDRMKLGVNFPPGFTDTSLILIGNKSMEDKSSFKLLSYMQPFNWYVWAAIVVTVFVTGMIYRVLHKIYYIERAHPNDSHHGEKNQRNLRALFNQMLCSTKILCCPLNFALQFLELIYSILPWQ